MLKNLIKWIFESQKQADELDDKLHNIGISLCPLQESEKNFFDYSRGLDIILDNIDLPEDFDEERMFEDFFMVQISMRSGMNMARCLIVIKHFCDMCSKQINMNVDGVSVMFNAQGMALRNSVNEDLHLCSDCCKKLKVFIRNSSENHK